MVNDNVQKTTRPNIVLDIDGIVGEEPPFFVKGYDLGALEIDLEEVFGAYGTSKKK